jgi:hypothetical protein
MTERAKFTQASVRRAIRAVQAEGLRVLGIRPDGLVIVGDINTPALLTETPSSASKWSDVEA